MRVIELWMSLSHETQEVVATLFMIAWVLLMIAFARDIVRVIRAR